MGNLTLEVMRGTSRDFPLQANPDDPVAPAWSNPGNPSPFVGSDALESTVWAGGDQSPLLSPATAWIDAVAATFRVSVGDADTLALDPGSYRIRTTATRSGRSGVILDGWLKVTGAPGTGTAAPAFTTYSDLLLYCPWLGDLQADEDHAGFAGEQARATDRFIDMLVNHWKPDRPWPSAIGPGAIMSWGAPGPINNNPTWWLRQQLVPLVPGDPIPATLPARLTNAPNLFDPRVSTCLLMHQAVKEACAKIALNYVLREQVTAGSDEGYMKLAKRYALEASSLYASRRWEIDLGIPQTGYAWFAIHGGVTSLR